MQGVYQLLAKLAYSTLAPTHRCANLEVISADGGSVVHGVEGSHFIDAHWWHFQYPGNLIHDADAREAVLALSEVEERHHGGLFVLGRVSGEDLLDELLILRSEFERYGRIVLGCVTVLRFISHAIGGEGRGGKGELHTTIRLSLRAGAVMLKARHWLRWSWRRARGALRHRNGVSFEAIVCVCCWRS